MTEGTERFQIVHGFRWVMHWSILVAFLVLSGPSGVWASPPLGGQEGSVEDVRHIVVHIEKRRFLPHLIHLRVGQPTRIELHNDDAELHAFVPTELLAKTNVQVEGNGAPQFDGQGFRRVLLPSNGKVQLTFSPKQVGSYPFFCDLPGHVMNGTVVVEE